MLVVLQKWSLRDLSGRLNFFKAKGLRGALSCLTRTSKKDNLSRISSNYIIEIIFSFKFKINFLHRSVVKWVREKFPDIAHLLDIWHVAKGTKMWLNNLIHFHTFNQLRIIIHKSTQNFRS